MVTQSIRINFNEFGKSLGTRFLGRRIRTELIEANLRSGNKVTFDLEGISIVSNSFADECFGKLVSVFPLEFIRANTHFANTSEVNTIIILGAFKQRLAQGDSATISA